MIKSSGLKIEHCGILHVASRWLILISLCSMHCFLRDRWLVNQSQLLHSKVLISLEEFYGWLKSFFPDLKTGVTLANSISFFFLFLENIEFYITKNPNEVFYMVYLIYHVGMYFIKTEAFICFQCLTLHASKNFYIVKGLSYSFVFALLI